MLGLLKRLFSRGKPNEALRLDRLAPLDGVEVRAGSATAADPDDKPQPLTREQRMAAPFETVVERGMSELQIMRERHDSLFGLADCDWDVDLDIGTITFTNPDGRVATAPVQVVGTVDTTDGTWLWSWANPSIPEASAADARLVREYGQRHEIDPLTDERLEIEESDAWDLTALAAHLAGAQGAYRGPAGPTLVFMTYGAVSVSQGRRDRQPE